jgi:alpha-glucosidase
MRRSSLAPESNFAPAGTGPYYRRIHGDPGHEIGATTPCESRAASGLADPHHDGSELYVDRFGDAAELRLRVPDGAADAVLLRYVRDGEARTVAATAASRGDGETWWQAEVPLRNPVLSYRWLLTGGRLGYRWVNSTGMHAHEVPPTDDFKLTAEPGGPDWHLSSVVYEIFIDRFAAGGRRPATPDWAVRRDWDRRPEVGTRDANRELFGGDLAGVEQHLDWIESLGANTIYLTPFFPAGSNHRYDPASFDEVDPFLGGDEALASLERAAHARGMKVVGDVPLGYTGARHEWFTRAQADAGSVERSFFFFDRSETYGYATWLYKEQPRFDWRSPVLRERMSEIIRQWLDRGLDGWRIGAAAMVGRYGCVDLNAEIARWTRAQVGESLLVADYWNDFRTDLDGLGWHGVTNYAGFLRPVWWWLRSTPETGEQFDVFSVARAPTYGGTQAAEVMRSTRAGVPWEASLHSWLLLDTHDTPRFRDVVDSREQQLVGVGLQMTTPGVPMVFAGAELGLHGTSGHDARRTMPWDDPTQWDEALLREYRRLIALRRASDALARGGFRYVHVSDDAIAYLRETKVERILCLAARAPHDPISVPFGELETLYGDDANDGVLPADGPAFHVWRIA